ncbi:hypothetical protein ACHAXT_003927 [Thalassiosira profunda]
MNRVALLFFLGGAASASARPDDICPARGNSPFQGLPDDVLVDCMDVEASLDEIAQYLTNSEVSSFDGGVLCPSDGVDYASAKKQYASARVETSPSYIVDAMNEVDVRAAVLFAGHCDYELTVRSGGHNYIGISSCVGTDTPCIQLDVGNIDHIEPLGSPGQKQIRAGPGAYLKDFSAVCVDQEVFVPTGECDKVALGGHIQTGGFGPWGRTFGPLTNRVAEFKIVLADGSLRTVTKPQEGEQNKFNEDLWYAVLGGASGSYGVVVDILLDTFDDNDYFTVYWEVDFLVSDTTLPGIIKMLRKYAEVIADANVANDTRWNLWWSFVGAKKLLQLNPDFPQGLELDYLQLDFNWVERKTPGFDEAAALGRAKAFYDSIVNECDIPGCMLDDYFDLIAPAIGGQPVADALKLAFAFSREEKGNVSKLNQDLTLFMWEKLRLEEFNVPFKSSFQQGPNFPDADGMETIVRGIVDSFPQDLQALSEAKLVIAQLATLPSLAHVDDTRALPFQEDKFAVTFDLWDYTPLFPPFTAQNVDDFASVQRAFQDKVINATGGLDHRMFWAAYDSPCLECGDWELYYDSRPKYNRLSSIKRCVDPDNVFNNRMSMPVNPLNDK